VSGRAANGPAVTEPVPLRVLWLAAGFAVWASAFIVLYGLQAIGCAYAWPALVFRLVLGVVLAAHLAALALMIRHTRRRPRERFLDTVTHWTLWAALVSTVVTFVPALALTACIP
jgi:hypothetical protein